MANRQFCPQCRAVFRAGFARCPIDGAVLEALQGDPLLGETFANRYVIEECVGEGGMGRVYRARHTRVSRRFALKVLFGDLSADSRMRARFVQEGEAASRLSHPNLVSVLDVGETPEGQLYLVMDYVEGRSLKALIAEQAPLEANRAANLLRQLASGLGHAHGRGLVHRDFKPENVIITRGEEGEMPKILDFGIARITDIGLDHSLTTDGQVMGTPAYMSPEHATGAAIDARLDLFSLGVVLYEMLCGKQPFSGNKIELMHQNLAVAPPAIATRVPGLVVDSRLEAMAMRLMAKNPDDRYPDSKAILEEIAGHPTLPPELRQRARRLDSVISSDSLLIGATKQTTLDPRLRVPSSSAQTVIQRIPGRGDALQFGPTDVDTPAVDPDTKAKTDPSLSRPPPVHDHASMGDMSTQLVDSMVPELPFGGPRRSVNIAVIAAVAVLLVMGGIAAVLLLRAVGVLPTTKRPTVGVMTSGAIDAGATVMATPVDAGVAVVAVPIDGAPDAAVVEASRMGAEVDAGAAVEAMTDEPPKSRKRRRSKKSESRSAEKFLARYRKVATRYDLFVAAQGDTADGRRAAKLYNEIDLSRSLHDPEYLMVAWDSLTELSDIIDQYRLSKKERE